MTGHDGGTTGEYDELTGTVDVRLTGVGSKSEMESVVLVVDDSDTVVPLRRRDAVALDAEGELARYQGRRVRVRGSKQWTTFVVDDVEELDPPTA
jgi:hypothetical protein